jgi:hypothetical protein
MFFAYQPLRASAVAGSIVRIAASGLTTRRGGTLRAALRTPDTVENTRTINAA